MNVLWLFTMSPPSTIVVLLLFLQLIMFICLFPTFHDENMEKHVDMILNLESLIFCSSGVVYLLTMIMRWPEYSTIH